MNQNRVALFFAGILFIVLAVFLIPASPAFATSEICDGFDSGKIDTVGDPATVEVAAPNGFLIDGYCVKAGTTTEWHDVTPPALMVIIDHTEKDSVSHYALSYVAIVPTPTPTPEPTCAPGEELQPNGEGYLCGPADEPCPGETVCPPLSTVYPPALPLTGWDEAKTQKAALTAVLGVSLLLIGFVLYVYAIRAAKNHSARSDK